MRRFALSFVVLAAVACATPTQSLRIVNRTGRPIEAVYVFTPGSDRGAPRTSLAPEGTYEVKVKPGAVEVLGVSAKMQIDDHTRDQPSASKVIEVRGPSEVVFYDVDAPPAGIGRPGVFGVAFRPLKPTPTEPDEPMPPIEPDAAP